MKMKIAALIAACNAAQQNNPSLESKIMSYAKPLRRMTKEDSMGYQGVENWELALISEHEDADIIVNDRTVCVILHDTPLANPEFKRTYRSAIDATFAANIICSFNGKFYPLLLELVFNFER